MGNEEQDGKLKKKKNKTDILDHSVALTTRVDQMFTLNKLYEKIDKEAENVRVGLKTWKRHMTRLN